MKYYLQFTNSGAHTKDGARCNVVTSADGKTYTHTKGFNRSQHSVDAANESEAIVALGLVPYVEPVKPMRSLTKFALTEKLIVAGKSVEFASLIDALPLAEKLVWNATTVIEPSNAMLVAYRATVLSVLGMTGLEFDNLFRV
jgi:hypothetical protein